MRRGDRTDKTAIPVDGPAPAITSRLQNGRLNLSTVDALILANSARRLRILWELEDTFALVADSFLEFERIIFDCALRQMYDFSMGRPGLTHWEADHLRVNQAILSLLANFSSYKYHRRVKFSEFEKLLGNLETKRDSEFSNALSSSFQFALMNLMRDLAQHESLPLGGNQFGTKQQNTTGRLFDEPYRQRLTFNPYVKVDQLLRFAEASRAKDQIGAKNFLKDLKAESISLKWLVRGFMTVFGEIHYSLRATTADQVDSDLSFIQEIHRRYEDAGVGEAKFLQLEINGEPSDVTISLERLDRIVEIRKNWSAFRHANQSFVSNELHFVKDVFPNSDQTVFIPE